MCKAELTGIVAAAFSRPFGDATCGYSRRVAATQPRQAPRRRPWHVCATGPPSALGGPFPGACGRRQATAHLRRLRLPPAPVVNAAERLRCPPQTPNLEVQAVEVL
jgi:hypothetical protein